MPGSSRRPRKHTTIVAPARAPPSVASAVIRTPPLSSRYCPPVQQSSSPAGIRALIRQGTPGRVGRRALPERYLRSRLQLGLDGGRLSVAGAAPQVVSEPASPQADAES